VHAPAVPIFAGDVSFRMTDFARRNAQRAGVEAGDRVQDRDALQRPPAWRLHGTLMLNPPYGERIEVAGKAHAAALRDSDREGGGRMRLLRRAWPRTGSAYYAGWTAWLLSPDMKLPGADAAEGQQPARADVERADRVPAVPLRAGRRRRRPPAPGSARPPGRAGCRAPSRRGT
jgi:23S rRNA G2445 N2-methylase RlmL